MHICHLVPVCCCPSGLSLKQESEGVSRQLCPFPHHPDLSKLILRQSCQDVSCWKAFNFIYFVLQPVLLITIDTFSTITMPLLLCGSILSAKPPIYAWHNLCFLNSKKNKKNTRNFKERKATWRPPDLGNLSNNNNNNKKSQFANTGSDKEKDFVLILHIHDGEKENSASSLYWQL